HSYAFDFSVWEIWGALLYGGKLIIVPDNVRRSSRELLTLLRDQSVTVLNQTPSAFYALAEEERQAAYSHRPLALRYVIFGGEALDVRKLSAWYDRHPEDQPALTNMYGITETTVHVTFVRLNRQIVDEAKR